MEHSLLGAVATVAAIIIAVSFLPFIHLKKALDFRQHRSQSQYLPKWRIQWAEQRHG